MRQPGILAFSRNRVAEEGEPIVITNAQADHALRAVRAASAMMQEVCALSETLDPELQLQVGIGVHTGEAVLGNIGSPDRLDFSAIGDAVNLAKRLQEVAGPGQVLMSQRAHEQTRPWCREFRWSRSRSKGVRAWSGCTN